MDSEPHWTMEDWSIPGAPFQVSALRVEIGGGGIGRSGSGTDKEERRRFRIASDWLKSRWVPQRLGMKEVEWIRGAHGKPLLAGAASRWGFNMSHAGEYVVAVLGADADLGVDLELMTRPVRWQRLCRRVFSPAECEWVAAGGTEAFLELWAQKEALLKALGVGWSDGGIVRRTALKREAYQIEPLTGVAVWSRRMLSGSYHLAIACRER